MAPPLDRPTSPFKCSVSRCFHDVFLGTSAVARAPSSHTLARLESSPAHGKICTGLERGQDVLDGVPLGSKFDLSGPGPLERPAEKERLDSSEARERGREALVPTGELAEKDESPVLLDPLERVLAFQCRPAQATPAPGSSSAPVLDQVAEQVLKRVQVSGDGRSGRVRMELRLGGVEGSTVELEYDDRGGLQVHVELPADATEGTRRTVQALETRLGERGLPLTSFEVD